MERLTTDKDVSEMNMTELAFNSCYAKDGFVRYRDFENDYDARDLARMLIKKYTGEDVPTDDEEFDEYIVDDLQYGIFSTSGFMALFYRNLWAMAELREKLKEYEDAEENGLLVRLPCKVGETIWVIGVMGNPQAEPFEVICMTYRIDKYEDNGVYVYAVGNGRISFFLNDELGKSVFLTQAEAEAKLKEMEGENADSN